jgi:hypothetical protein
MPLYARFFNKRNEMVVDIPLQMPFLQFIANVRTDGALLTDGVFLPVDQIALALVFEPGEAPKSGTVINLVPPPDKPA